MYLKRVVLVCVILSSSAFAIDANKICDSVSKSIYTSAGLNIPGLTNADLNQRAKLKEHCSIMAGFNSAGENCISAVVQTFSEINSDAPFSQAFAKCEAITKIPNNVAYESKIYCMNSEIKNISDKFNIDAAAIVNRCPIKAAPTASTGNETKAPASVPATAAATAVAADVPPSKLKDKKADVIKPPEAPTAESLQAAPPIATAQEFAVMPPEVRNVDQLAQDRADKVLPPNYSTEKKDGLADAADGNSMADQIDHNSNNPAPIKYNDKEVEQAMREMGGESPQATATDLQNNFPALGQSPGNVVNTMDITGTEPVAKASITKAAEMAEKKVRSLITNLDTVTGSLRQNGFVISAGEITKIQTSINKYLETKKVCTAGAESASFYCAEGSSTGVKAVNFMMNFGSPILAALNSAQKSCSTLSKLTSLAAAGLTAAKAVCATTKFMCDGKCGKSQTEFANIIVDLKKVMTIVNSEIINANNLHCQGKCPVEARNAAIGINNQITQIANEFNTEGEPKSQGSNGSMLAGCADHAKDLMLMAVNIIGVVKASKSAKKCGDELATTGGAPLTPQQYCETPANAQTVQCKCQKDLTAVGCPGAPVAVVDPKAVKLPNDIGSDLKPGGGVSGFATNTKPITPKSNLTSPESLTGPAAVAAGIRRAIFGGGGSGKAAATTGSDVAGGSGSGGAEAASDANKAGSKKWNFGSFGSFGGGGSGSSGSDKNAVNGNGGLGEKEMNALKRKIASEQVAAEVSPASGKSNFEKVKRMYLFKENSFIGK